MAAEQRRDFEIRPAKLAQPCDGARCGLGRVLVRVGSRSHFLLEPGWELFEQRSRGAFGRRCPCSEFFGLARYSTLVGAITALCAALLAGAQYRGRIEVIS